MLALLRHAQRVGGLVHVVAAALADITEGLEPDRQETAGHGSCPILYPHADMTPSPSDWTQLTLEILRQWLAGACMGLFGDSAGSG